MRNTIFVLGLFILAGCLSLGVSQSNAEADFAAGPQVWEYKIINLMKIVQGAVDQDSVVIKLEDELNKLGQDGWEVSLWENNAIILRRSK